MGDITDKRKKEIEQIVGGILEDYPLNISEPTVDIVSLVKKDGFLVQTGNLPDNETGCLAVNDEDSVLNSGTHRLIIVSNNFKNPDNEENVVVKKSRFITAHEYGHFKLHKPKGQPYYAHRDNVKRDTVEEKEADYFARSILMPAKVFIQIYQLLNESCRRLGKENPSINESAFSDYKIEFISKYFNVTKNKAERRMEDIDLLLSINK